MKNTSKADVVVSAITSEDNLIHATISEAKKSKLFDLLQNPYSDPISSIVREITSNCIDAHADKKVDDPVRVNVGIAEEGYYIEFIDKGIGMGPDFIRDTYSHYLESTKENTNDQLGYFGIGSKSPLSYADEFQLITKTGGKQYYYIVRKDDEGIPVVQFMMDLDCDINDTGTTVKIPIEDKDDTKEFIKAIMDQLKYFDNVYVDVDRGTGLVAPNNNYEIYDAKYYKIRNNDPNQQALRVSDTMHMSIGRVTYPINWKRMSMDAINVAIAVKFDIGEIPVTLTRESVKYNRQVVELMQTRIKAAAKEFIEKVIADNSFTDIWYFTGESNTPIYTVGDMDYRLDETAYGLRPITIAADLIGVPLKKFVGFEYIHNKDIKYPSDMLTEMYMSNNYIEGGSWKSGNIDNLISDVRNGNKRTAYIMAEGNVAWNANKVRYIQSLYPSQAIFILKPRTKRLKGYNEILGLYAEGYTKDSRGFTTRNSYKKTKVDRKLWRSMIVAFKDELYEMLHDSSIGHWNDFTPTFEFLLGQGNNASGTIDDIFSNVRLKMNANEVINYQLYRENYISKVGETLDQFRRKYAKRNVMLVPIKTDKYAMHKIYRLLNSNITDNSSYQGNGKQTPQVESWLVARVSNTNLKKLPTLFDNVFTMESVLETKKVPEGLVRLSTTVLCEQLLEDADMDRSMLYQGLTFMKDMQVYHEKVYEYLEKYEMKEDSLMIGEYNVKHDLTVLLHEVKAFDFDMIRLTKKCIRDYQRYGSLPNISPTSLSDIEKGMLMAQSDLFYKRKRILPMSWYLQVSKKRKELLDSPSRYED